MRISNRLMVETINRNIAETNTKIMDLQNIVGSGKRINKPSDDPIGAGMALQYKEALAKVDQYSRNIDFGDSWLAATENALGSVSSSLIRAKSLAVYQATESSSAQTRLATAEEIKGIYDEVMRLANTRLGNRYIFSGHLTDTPAFTRDEEYTATYGGDAGSMEVIIGEGVTIRVNRTGDGVFQDPEADIFAILKGLKEALEANDTEGIQAQIDPLTAAIDHIQEVRAGVGAAINRLEVATTYWNDFKTNLTNLLSETEDADLVDTISALKSQEVVYETVLASSSRIFEQGLVAYLR